METTNTLAREHGLAARVENRLGSIKDTRLFCQSVFLDILIDTHAPV